jgi:hypothetical protein
MQNINDQLESEEWEYFERSYLSEHDGRLCEGCQSYTGLSIYLREIHRNIEFIWNYPESALGIICNRCSYLRNKKINEVMATINQLSSASLDTLLDTFEIVKSLGGHQEVCFERLFVSAKQIRR